MGKSNTWIYIGSIGLIIAAIAVTAVIDRSKSQEDIRAKAGVVTGQAATATVSSINEPAGALLVTNFAIGEGTSANSTQVWTLRLSGDVNTATLAPGMRVRLSLDPTTVKIDSRTATVIAATPDR